MVGLNSTIVGWEMDSPERLLTWHFTNDGHRGAGLLRFGLLGYS